MIHEVYLNVFCDNERCKTEEWLEDVFTVGARGGYYYEDEKVYEKLESMGWIVKGENTYCCEVCAE